MRPSDLDAPFSIRPTTGKLEVEGTQLSWRLETLRVDEKKRRKATRATVRSIKVLTFVPLPPESDKDPDLRFALTGGRTNR